MTDTTKMQVLETFMARTQTAARMGSKELRLPIQEGFELAGAIGQILAENVRLSAQLRDTEALIGAQIRVDGGKFG